MRAQRSAGSSRVFFDRDITRCTYFTGTATDDGGTQLGSLNITNSSGDDKGVDVHTHDTSGNPANLGFLVQVIC